MDGDQRMKQHERLMARSGTGAATGRATDRFEMHPRGDPTGMSQAPDRAQMSYDYGYTGNAFHGGPLQTNEVSGYQPEFARARQPAQPAPQQRGRRQEVPPFLPYDLYGFGHQGPTQGPFDVVPQYPARQSAAIEALSTQFSVPQYFTPEEPSATGVPGALSTYLNAQMPYNQPGLMARPSTTQPFPATMTDFPPVGAAPASRLEASADPSQLPSSDPSSLDEAYAQYQRALRSTFDQTRAGRLVEASRSLLEISEWLVTNARDLGKFRPFLTFWIVLRDVQSHQTLSCAIPNCARAGPSTSSLFVFLLSFPGILPTYFSF